jgi:hypothetical protein
MKPSDETLMAYADGELTAAERSAVEAALRADTEVRARLAVYEDTRDLLRSALGGVAAEPVPDRLVAAVMNAAPSPPLRGAMPGPGRIAGRLRPRHALPLAASVALCLGFAGGHLLAPPAPEPIVAVAKAIGPALERMPSGDAASSELGEVMPLATVRLPTGQYCREFEILPSTGRTLTGVACREEAGWMPLGLLVEEVPATGESFVPADGPPRKADLLLGLVSGNADTITPEGEAAILAGGWRETVSPGE